MGLPSSKQCLMQCYNPQKGLEPFWKAALFFFPLRTFVNVMVWIVLYGSLLSYIIGICDSAQPFIKGTILEERF